MDKKEGVEIKEASELVEYLFNLDGRDAYQDYDYQLGSNGAWIHELKNGEVVFLPAYGPYKGLVFKTKKMFIETLKSDQFPIENPNRDVFNLEKERIQNIHNQICFYKNHLNTTFKLSFSEISKEAAQAYLNKIIGRTIRKLTTPTDKMGLIAVVGEIVRTELNGR